MAFVPVPDGCKVAVEYTLWDQECVNTFHFTNPGSWGATELDDLCDTIFTVFADWVDTYMGANFTLQRVTAVDLRTQFGYQGISSASPVVGTAAAPVEPNNVAIAVKRSSGLTGRSTRGRVYLPVSVDANTTGANNITSTFATACLNMLNALAAAAATIDFTEVIASYVQNGVPLTTALVYVVTSRAIVNTVIDSMRRRLPGRGN